MKKFLLGICIAISSILGIGIWVLGAGIHLYTIIMAFAETGWIGAFITLMLPILAEIYWMFASWKMVGTIFNTYCLAIFAYVFLIVISTLFSSFVSWRTTKAEREEFECTPES